MQAILPLSTIITSLLAAAPVALGQGAAGPSDYVACWSLDEGAGTTVADSSANGFGGGIRGAQWTVGVSGAALEFDGIDDSVELRDGDGAPDLLGELAQGTLSVWFRFDSTPPPNRIHPIFYFGSDGSERSSVLIEVGHFGTEKKLYFTTRLPVGVAQCFDTGFDLETGRWYHFAAVVGAGFNTGYLDGVELTDRHYNFGGPTDDYFLADVVNPRKCWLGYGFLGALPEDQFHDGALDEVRVYDRPLSAAEIAELHAAGTGAWAPSFCDASDGSLAACPCANPGGAASGCDLPQATGGVGLSVLAQTTSPNGATLQGSGFPSAGSPTAVVIRSAALDASRPVVFGDGLRCVDAASLVRLAATTALGGVSTHAFGHGAAAGPGVFYYQLWFRSTPSTYCDPSGAFNLSSGRTLAW